MKVSWHVISIISRFIAVGVGLIQSIIIVKLLSVGDYGLIGLVTSVAAVVGVYQSLGLSSGSTREIAAARDIKEAFKVFVGSLAVRYSISLPLVISLFIGASYIAEGIYERQEIATPLKIFALILFIQAFQSVLNSVIQGLKRFKFLFTFQAGIAFLSLIIVVPLLLLYGFIGYFYAFLLHNVVSTLILGIYVFKIFVGNVELPTKKEFISIIKTVFSIGLFVYVIKIVFTQWQKLGPIMLGKILNNEMLGIFTFALLVSSKVTAISDAITDVTLPSMTEAFETSRKQFREIFMRGNTKAYLFIMFSSVLLIILKREIFLVVDIIFNFIGKTPISMRYEYAFMIMDPLILAFWAYSHLNLLKSGLSVPTKNLIEPLLAYITMFLITISVYSLTIFEPLLSFSISMGIGALAGYILLLLIIKRRVGFYPFSKVEGLYTVTSLVIVLSFYLGLTFWILVPVYSVATYFIYAGIKT